MLYRDAERQIDQWNVTDSRKTAKLMGQWWHYKSVGKG